MSFAEFKNALLEYFSDPNTVIQLQNEFNTIKQGTGKTIEAIEQGYYINPQVLNQFIRGLKSSILGRVHPAHPDLLSEAVMLAKALELAEKEANYSQIVNIVIEENKTKTLEKRKVTSSQTQEKITHTKHFKDATRNSAAAKIIACCIRTSEQKHVPAIFANINQYTPIPCQYFTMYQNQKTYQQ
ncbi:hypothetical protein G9A89_015601 [Geosiphon pyriformis]|nr:hypothetical protein G9A89_015601 [Geosiphon pyriformis]